MHDSEDWRDCPGSSLVYAGRGREGRVRGRGERGGEDNETGDSLGRREV